jgi:ABC-type glycerol-3-phosphate transport system substrate-binding protein
MKHRIKTAAVAMGLAVGLALAGCSSTATPAASGDAKAAATITFLTFQSPNLTKAFWESQVSEIHKIYPKLTVKIEYTPGLDRQGYAKQLLASGNLPDVIWDAPLNDFVKANALLPYSSSDLIGIDAPASAGAIGGKHYSLTLGAQVIPMIYYNKDVFAKLDLSVPTTFSQLETVAAKIKASGQNPFLIGGGGTDTWTSTMFLDGMITSNILSSNPKWQQDLKAGKVHFSDSNFTAAVTKWKDLFAKGYFNSDALTLDYSKLQAAFAGGEGVMYPMGSWAGTTKAPFNVGVFPLPGATKTPTLGLNYGQALYVSAKTKYPAQSRAFAVALGTGKGANLAQLNSDSLIPVVKGLSIPADTAPLIKDTFGAYKTAGATYVDPFEWTQGADALPSGFNAVFDKGAQGILLGGDVSAFLSSMDSQYKSLNQ